MKASPSFRIAVFIGMVIIDSVGTWIQYHRYLHYVTESKRIGSGKNPMVANAAKRSFRNAIIVHKRY